MRCADRQQSSTARLIRKKSGIQSSVMLRRTACGNVTPGVAVEKAISNGPIMVNTTGSESETGSGGAARTEKTPATCAAERAARVGKATASEKGVVGTPLQ